MDLMRNRHLLLIDLVLLAPLPFLALALRMESFVWPFDLSQAAFAYAALALPIRIGVAHVVGIYRFLWRHASLVEMERLVFAGATSAVLTFITGAVLIRFFGLAPIRLPFSSLLLDALLASALMVAPRLAVRFAARRPVVSRRSQQRAIIVGAGGLGQGILRELSQDAALNSQILPVAFVDDDPYKKGQFLGGLPVVGAVSELAEAVDTWRATEVIIAVSGAKGAFVRRVVDSVSKLGITPRIVPGVRDIIDGRVGVQALRKVEIEDLLRRDPIVTDLAAVGELVHGKVVLVTGAGGSIGSELCRQIAPLQPTKLLVLDHSENQIFEIHNELLKSFPETAFVPVIADIRHLRRVSQVFERFKPAVVFHAAAHKHVPLMEENVVEAITNNILGTSSVVEASIDAGVETFVLISTDKAVRPSSVMGCTKRVAEQVVTAAAQQTGRNFVSVRFGNVLGSRGSVIPTFLKQIEAGGPVTVTHHEMRRYFMTIPEAVQLVLQAGAMGKSGELFVLDMGEPVRIVDLAKDLIRLSGLEEGVDVDVAFTGIRPGEKLYEEIFFGHEEVVPTTHPKVLRSPADPVDNSRTDLIESLIRQALDHPDNWDDLRIQLRSLVPDFNVPLPPPDDERVQMSRDSGEQKLRLA
ncbi:MAG: polysaccharide biosynthesis protein [Nitrospira sp.]|nr:polysaccharide biosynthesis protein [Nitrospira sp.]